MTEKQSLRCVRRILNNLFSKYPDWETQFEAQENWDRIRVEEELARVLKEEYES